MSNQHGNILSSHNMETEKSNAPTVKHYWFDKDHGGVIVRFMSSDLFRNLATIITVLAASVSIYVTSLNQKRILETQVEAQRKDLEFQADKAANDVWISYQELALKFEEFYDGVEYSSVSNEAAHRYALLAERLVMAADIVTVSLMHDAQWEGAFANEFRRHRQYFLSPNFLNSEAGRMSEYCTYRFRVRKWIANTFKDDQESCRRVEDSEKACQAHFKSIDYVEEEAIDGATIFD